MEFKTGEWNKEVNVRDFIQRNYTPYDGDKSFLTPASDRTRTLWEKLCALMKIERERKGVYDIDEKTISTIDSHEAGYIDRELEQIVGLQTDAPLKRAIIRLVETPVSRRIIAGEIEPNSKLVIDRKGDELTFTAVAVPETVE